MYVDSKTRLAFFNDPVAILVGGGLVMVVLKRNAETESTRRRNDLVCRAASRGPEPNSGNTLAGVKPGVCLVKETSRARDVEGTLF